MRRVSVLGLTVVLAACGSDARRGGGSNQGPPEAKLVAQALAIQVAEPVIEVGGTAAATIKVTYDDASEAEVTEGVLWSSDNVAVATVDAGTITAVSEGVATVTAQFAGLSATLAVTVTPMGERLVSLAINPTTARVRAGESVPLQVMATFTSGNQTDVTDRVQWGSSAPDVAVVVSGAAAGLVAGQAIATATYGSQSASATLTVVTLQQLEVAAPSQAINIGSTTQLTVQGVWSDDAREPATGVTWASDNPAIVSVTDTGIATAVAQGTANVTATRGELSASFGLTVTACAFPASAGTSIRNNATMPRVSWTGAYDGSGNQLDFDLEDVYCGNGPFAGVDSVHFILSAGWCPQCPAYLRRVNSMASQIQNEGGMIVYIEIETANYSPASNRDAQTHADRLISNGPGLRVGDGETMPRAQIFGRAVRAVPSAFVVRTSDMQVIAAQGETNYQLNFPQLAREAKAGPAPANCSMADEEPFEPNDTFQDASPIALDAAAIEGGICASAPDFYRIEHTGNWTLDLQFSHAEGDLDVYVWDTARNEPLVNGQRRVGSESSDDNERFSHSGPATIAIVGYQGATAKYRLLAY